MTFTDTANHQKKTLSETQTFSVQSHTAEALKSQINRENGQQLERRIASAPRAKRRLPGEDADGQNRVSVKSASASGAARSANPGTSAHPAVANSASSANHAEQTSASPNANNSTANRANPSASANAQTPARQTESRNVQSAEVQRSTASSDSMRNSAPVDRQMMKTRESDLKIETVPKREKSTADSSRQKKKTEKKKKEPKNEGSGEGGNTVVSLVKAVVYIIFILVVSIALAVVSIAVANDVFAFVKEDEAVEITIPENTTLDELSQILYENEVIEFPKVFKLYAVVKEDDQEYLPGTYTVTPMMNYDFLLAEFKEKEVTGTVTVTIPEGYTTDDIINLFVDRYEIGTREGFEDIIQNYEFDYWFVKELEENGIKDGRIYRLDGYLFPDTYEFYSNSSELTVVNKMLRRFSQIFSKEYRNVTKELGYTVDEIVTLASMIEKEAGTTQDFFNVSSVFHNRMNNSWSFPRLESDATVVYAIQHDTGERTVDLFYDTPYNTYQHEGLPPGPIANPSASALLAALHPVETNYFYFVAGDSGETYFSETKAEHNQYIDDIRREALARIEAENPTPITAPPSEEPEETQAEEQAQTWTPETPAQTDNTAPADTTPADSGQTTDSGQTADSSQTGTDNNPGFGYVSSDWFTNDSSDQSASYTANP